MNRERDRREILFHLSLQKVGSHLVQHMAKSVIHLGEEDRLIDACCVLKGDKLHGIAVLCLNCLARDQPPASGDLFTHVEMKIDTNFIAR